MDRTTVDLVKKELQIIKSEDNVSDLVFRKGHSLYLNGQSQLLTQSKQLFEFSVDDEFNDFRVGITVNGDISAVCNCKSDIWCHHKIACLMQLHEDLSRDDSKPQAIGKEYTRQGMIKRVLDERAEKAKKAEYRIEPADNVYGEHVLYNEKGQQYKLTFYNFNKEQGYCSCPDYRSNKLGTCKHLMFAFNYFKSNNKTLLVQKHQYPFVEVFLNPLKDYKISWFYPHDLTGEIKLLIYKFFGNKKVLPDDELLNFLRFIQEAAKYKQIKIRPEVHLKVEKAFNTKMLTEIKDTSNIDFSIIKRELFKYQEQGIEFAAFRQGSIIADEMGLGKTLQAIGAAIAKKEIFGFSRTLVICPASLKEQWKNEIERFSDEKATVVEGFPEDRKQIYQSSEDYFLIVNYETVLRDSNIINKYSPDFIILDEAQRIKNYSTLTSSSIKSLKKKHALIITGTPIENRLIDLYSITSFIDPQFLSPLWEFSYQHCYFDARQKNKITGYYNLRNLKIRLSGILIRREKHDVIKQLPNVSNIDVPVSMHPEQQQYHASYARGIAKILSKKFITPFDMQRLMLLLSKMRMVCDSTYLVDFETNYSPKLIELKHILLEKLDLKNNKRKVIIFSEWKRMNNIIAKMLRDENIGFVELHGSIPVKNRGKLIKEFEENENCRVFVSTEAGGTGLNLQVADTVINFELPWNPAKKNQRIGRIDRLGQKNENLTVISFISRNSIEEKIASGLVLKQNLFESVLSPGNDTEFVDFTEKGRAQFLSQLENVIDDIDKQPEAEAFEKEEEKAHENIADIIKEVDDDTTQEKQKAGKPIDQSVGKDTADKEPGEKMKQTVTELETVMNQGLGFISGLFKMATGKELTTEEQSIQVNKETGEVTMKFKLPM